MLKNIACRVSNLSLNLRGYRLFENVRATIQSLSYLILLQVGHHKCFVIVFDGGNLNLKPTVSAHLAPFVTRTNWCPNFGTLFPLQQACFQSFLSHSSSIVYWVIRNLKILGKYKPYKRSRVVCLSGLVEEYHTRKNVRTVPTSIFESAR